MKILGHCSTDLETKPIDIDGLQDVEFEDVEGRFKAAKGSECKGCCFNNKCVRDAPCLSDDDFKAEEGLFHLVDEIIWQKA